RFKKLFLFSGNDYLGLSSHPTIGKAAAKALLESCLADLKKKEVKGYVVGLNYNVKIVLWDCLLCPTWFSAYMALMVTLGNVGSLLASGIKPLQHEKVAIFSDALNHGSVIDVFVLLSNSVARRFSSIDTSA
ncbi:Pyridoxal phosphate-dependent transferase, major region, subdomain, partial [Trema orientale]